eukprot:1140406-Pelagomonas_calceolata.AAC.15
MQLGLFWGVKRLRMSGSRLTAKCFPHGCPDHRKAGSFAGRVKAGSKRPCQAVLEIGATCLTQTMNRGTFLRQLVKKKIGARACAIYAFGPLDTYPIYTLFCCWQAFQATTVLAAEIKAPFSVDT